MDNIVKYLEDAFNIEYSEEQKDILNHRGGMCILACAGSGKALKNGTKVATPVGFVNIEDLYVGHPIYGTDGKEHSVIGVFPQGKKRIVVLNIGNKKVECSLDHLWKVTLVIHGMKKDRILTTDGITKFIDKGVKVYVPVMEDINNPFVFNKFSIENREVSRYIILDAEADMTCIKVDTKDSLFILENGVVTHNTTILTHLLTKRILSGEIANPNTLLCTTYSKAGADEMNKRLKDMFNTLGLKYKVTIKTMHAVYLEVLHDLGFNFGVIDGGTRRRYIREAYRELDIPIMDEESEQELDSLLSYQVNNLLSDEALYNSYAFNLENISLRDYSQIRQGYADRKSKNNLIDFDDMQLYLYIFLCQQNREDIINYCKYKWSDIYIDEAQDISKIQYEILKKLITSADKFVIIGDDDQCLVSDTKIHTQGKIKNISELLDGDFVGVCNGLSGFKLKKCDKVCHRKVDTDVIEIKTLSGKRLMGTLKHQCFVLDDEEIYSNEPWVEIRMFGSNRKNEYDYYDACIITSVENEEYAKIVSNYMTFNDDLDIVTKHFKDYDLCKKYVKCLYNDCYINGIKLKVLETAILGNNKYRVVNMDEIQAGMKVPVITSGNTVTTDLVIGRSRKNYVGTVYDVSIPEYRNFVANEIIVHNCIYQWRGADPSIILNICGEYDINRFVLSTNYRCKSNIVDLAATGIKNNYRRSDKSMVAYNDGGKVLVTNCNSESLYEYSLKAYKYIVDLINSGESVEDIAVLSRNNYHLSILNNMLIKKGIFVTCSEEMKFSRNKFYRIIVDALKLINDTRNADLVGKTLYNICRAFSKKNSLTLAAVLKHSALDLVGVLDIIKESTLHYKNTFPGVPSTVLTNIFGICDRISKDAIDDLITLHDLLKLSKKEDTARGLLGQMYNSISYRFSRNKDADRTFNGMVDYLSNTISNSGYEKTMEFLKMTELFEKGMLGVPGSKIVLSTVHSAKGREWKHLILFADDNIAFPSFTNLCKQYDKGVDKIDISYAIDEDRRLHYVAMTRAKEDILILTSFSNTSVFLLESLGIMNKSDGNDAIMNMAFNNKLDARFIAEMKDKMKNSEYKFDIDISNVNNDMEILDK